MVHFIKNSIIKVISFLTFHRDLFVSYFVFADRVVLVGIKCSGSSAENVTVSTTKY